MAALLRGGLLTILAAVVSADFEFSPDVNTVLPEFSFLVRNDAPLLKYKLINPGINVRLTRSRDSNGKGLFFYVDPRRSKLHDAEYFVPPANQKDTGSDKCFGRPGIKATLNRYRNSIMPLSQQVYCLNELHIDMFKTGDGKPHMRINVVFFDEKNRNSIGILMNPFKPPIKDGDDSDDALQLSSPIPMAEFLKPYLKPMKEEDQDGVQFFLGDIYWMEEALRRARIAESIDSFVLKTYTEWYSAGPVIIPAQAYDNILKLDFAVWKFATTADNCVEVDNPPAYEES